VRLCRALLLHRAPLADLVTLLLQLTIQKGTKIRLKIVGTRVDATEIVRRRSPSRSACARGSHRLAGTCGKDRILR